jgi:biotin carboxylase
MRRPRTVLLLAATTGYQTRVFGSAAEQLGIDLILATDRCDQLEDPWADRAVPIRFHLEDAALDALASAAREMAFDGVLAVGDRPTIIAARLAERLALPWHPPAAVAAARSKKLTRERLRAAGESTPRHIVIDRATPPRLVRLPFDFPVVVKPTILSGSRGVMRADDGAELVEAVARLQRLLASPDVRALHDSGADEILIEEFVPGAEFALEGIVEHGRLRILALFDKPDPLDGPFFEETIYVTPSRAGLAVETAIEHAVIRAIAALGLTHGPIHAECRVNGGDAVVLEVAPRPIGGLCAQALRFTAGSREASFEEVLLRHAVGEPIGLWQRQNTASGVMMIPIPAEGVYRRVEGEDEAREVRGVWEVAITAKPDQRLVRLPEAASCLGFIFARAQDSSDVERALRDAHARLRFVIDRAVTVRSAL